MSVVLDELDHLVLAAPDLDTGVAEIEAMFGIRATPGGQHSGMGTRNAIIAIGPSAYLEIVAPDPDQPPPAGPRWFGVDALPAPRLVTWAAKGTFLDQLVHDARRHGLDLGDVRSGSRRRPDGVVLSWRVTNPDARIADGLVPFFIDWEASPHPSGSAAGGLALVDFRAEHPDPDHVRPILGQLGLSLRVTRGRIPALIATFDGPRGRVELPS
jgi:hypothetical protein